MRAISINAARVLGKKSGARRLVILTLDGKDRYGITTWGLTKQECRALAKWAVSKKAIAVLCELARATPVGGHIYSSHDPEALDMDNLGVE